MNEQEALEYTRKKMVCATCFFYESGCCCNDIAHDLAEVGYTHYLFGCNQWSAKE